MTDRVTYLTVALDKDYRTDDVEVIVNAIKMIRGVQNVKLGEPDDMATYLSSQSFAREAYNSLFDVIYLASFEPQKFKVIASQAKLARNGVGH